MTVFRTMLSVFALLLLLQLGSVYSDDDRPSIITTQGTLIGQKVNSDYGTFYSFLGIPYAKPPLGDLRFKAPVPADPWNGTFEASKEGSICKQSSNFVQPDGNLTSDEDCLFVNIYIPQLPDTENLLPVLVWIHGGGFSFGSGNYKQQGPEFLLDRGIIYASINYRLGVFGFLCTEDEGAPGNAGLKDQSLALHWIHENIASFGGDPTKITIFGESAGSQSVHYHMLSPMSVGLFRGVIAESGSAALESNILPSPKENAFLVGSVLGYFGNNTHALLEFLRTIDADELLKATASVTSGDTTNLLFSPVVETVVEGETQFLTDLPSRLMNEGKFQDVPFLTGVNHDEGLYNAYADGLVDGSTNIEVYDENFVPTYKRILRVCRNDPCGDEMVAKIRSFYFEDGPLTNASFHNFTMLLMDSIFAEPTIYGIDRMFSKMTSAVYLYEFMYDGDLAFTKEVYPLLKKFPGVSHGDELGYLFNIGKSVPAGSAADKMRSKMVTLWTNFVKTGNPTPEATDDIPVWLPYNNSTAYYFNINSTITVQQYLEKRRMDFWKDLYSSYTV